MPKFLIFDTMNLAFRSYYANVELRTSQGHPSGMCYGFINSVNKILRDQRPDFVVFANDAKGPTFRHELYEGYKANRGPVPEDVPMQLEDLRRMLAAMEVPLVEAKGFEADDVIGTIARKAAGKQIANFNGQEVSDPIHVVIVSGDKDFMQLINDHTSLLRIMNDGPVLCDAMSVFERFGVDRPEQVIDVLALMGDAVDNVPGVKGVGEKTAAKLLKSFGSVEGIYENIHQVAGKMQEKLINGQAMARLSKSLVTIRQDVPLDLKLSQCYIESIKPFEYKEALDSFFREMEFYSLLSQGDDDVEGN